MKLTLEIEEGKHGLFFVTSPNIKGLLVTGHDFREALQNTPKAIEDLEAADKQHTEVK